jgi:hypothetical protein
MGMPARQYTPRQMRKTLKRVVDDRTKSLETFVEVVKRVHGHRLKSRSKRCQICAGLRALGEI